MALVRFTTARGKDAYFDEKKKTISVYKRLAKTGELHLKPLFKADARIMETLIKN